MAGTSGEKNYNIVVAVSTEVATEIRIRSEGFSSGALSAQATWASIRPIVRKFRELTDEIGEKFAFSKYQADVIAMMGNLIDQLVRDNVDKGK